MGSTQRELGGLAGRAAVFVGGLAADLPGAVHLVAQAPQLDVMRSRVAVLHAQVGERGAAGVVAVLDEPACVVGAAGAEVHAEHRLDACGPAPVDELVRAEAVGLGGEPGEVEADGTLLDRAHAALPGVAGEEVAAGIADHGRTELAHQRHHVASKAPLVRGRVAGLEDAGVDAAAQVLDEGAEQAPIELRDHEVAVDDELRGDHATTWLCPRSRPRPLP